ncbi:hypothetical protein ACFO0N_11975 [Halobium salinum]|uniref:Major facilitator superfamily (MFS) profile domain-containing protein n=1 Tax=Halobium salinum TaxID=1364940 RepID=A0ABD5PD07_9EURY|nr:hypothetical protein [Halobium salinum]
MTRPPPFDGRRALRYVVAATALAVVVGFYEQGSVGGALVLGLAVGVGVAVGLVLFEVVTRYWRP